MGRNKIKIERIENERIRQVTYYKRKRGLIKKSMELALLCEVKVLLCVMDNQDKMLFYTSDGETISQMQNFLLNDNLHKEYLLNSDYKDMFIESTKLSESDTNKSYKITENSIGTDNEKSFAEKEKNMNVGILSKMKSPLSQIKNESEKKLIEDLMPFNEENNKLKEDIPEARTNFPFSRSRINSPSTKQDFTTFFNSLKEKVPQLSVKPSQKKNNGNIQNLPNPNPTRNNFSINNSENLYNQKSYYDGMNSLFQNYFNQPYQNNFNSYQTPQNNFNNFNLNNSNNQENFNNNQYIQMLLNYQNQQQKMSQQNESLNNINYLTGLLNQQVNQTQKDFLLKRQRDDKFLNINDISKLSMQSGSNPNLQQNFSLINNNVNNNIINNPIECKINCIHSSLNTKPENEENVIKPTPTQEEGFKSIFNFNFENSMGRKDL